MKFYSKSSKAFVIALSLFLISCSKGGGGSNSAPTPAPTITSISVTSGPYNTRVIITGTGFSSNIADDKIFFNGKAAVITPIATSTKLFTNVPLAAGTGKVTVTVNSQTATGPVFTYIPAEVVTTFAGNFNPGTADGVGTAASFFQPYGIAIDKANNFYISDQEDGKIRKVTPEGVVSTFAGSGSQGFADGQGPAASFNLPAGLAVDASGNIFLADMGNGLIREISTTGQVTTIAGNRLPHSTNGQGTAASFNLPSGVTIDGSGNLYIAESGGGLIRKITSSGLVSTFAGGNLNGNADGTGTNAGFTSPVGITIDGTGNLYVADQSYGLIRKITTPGAVVTSLAGSAPGFANGTGTAAEFSSPSGVAVDQSGNVYVADTENFVIRKITPSGVVTTFAGTGYPGMDDGAAVNATFLFPLGLVIDSSGNIFVLDANAVREISFQ